MENVATLVLSIAFVPLSIIAAMMIFPTLKPPRHRPLLFFLAGLLLFSIGPIVIYALSSDLHSGIVHFTSRSFGEIYADASVQPIKYWTVILILYAIGIITSGVGLAGFRLCFRKINK